MDLALEFTPNVRIWKPRCRPSRNSWLLTWMEAPSLELEFDKITTRSLKESPFFLPVPTKLHLNASGGGKVQAFVRGCWCTTPGTVKHGLKGYHSDHRYAHNPMRIKPWCPESPDTDCDAAGWRGRYPGDLNWNWWMADIPNQMNNAPSTETYHPNTQVSPGEGTKQLCSAMAGQRYASLPKGFSAAPRWRDGSWAQVRWAWNSQVDTN